MQSVPVYYPHTYSPTSPYPTTSATTTTTTSSPGAGSTVMTISNPPLLATPMEQTYGASTETTTVKRNQVKNACSKLERYRIKKNFF